MVACVQPVITTKTLYRFIAAVFVGVAVLLIGYSWSLIYSSTPSSANFPGREVAQTITAMWHERYHTKLDYVAGSRWIGGNIEFYSPDHPAVFVEWETRKAPWINMRELRKRGAVFVWDISEGESMPAAVKATFSPVAQTELEFFWHRNKRLQPAKIGVAFLAPE